MQVEQTLKEMSIAQINDRQYTRIHICLNQLFALLQIIYDILNKIEIAITFSKLNILHKSIVDPNELLVEINKLKTQLINDKLPFDDSIQNILTLERVIKIKSYINKNKIIFLLEIPLVDGEVYQYFHLYPVPIPIKNNDDIYFILIYDNYTP